MKDNTRKKLPLSNKTKKIVLGVSLVSGAVAIGALYIENLILKNRLRMVRGDVTDQDRDEGFIFLQVPASQKVQEYTWWLRPHSHDPKALLRLAQSSDPAVRRIGVTALAQPHKWNDADYYQLAQALGKKALIGLARMPNVDGRFFLKQPSLPPSEVTIEEELYHILSLLPHDNLDQCTKYFISQAVIQAADEKPDNMGSVFTYYGDRMLNEPTATLVKTKTEKNRIISHCMQALHGASIAPRQANSIIQLGGLAAFQRLHEKRSNDIEVLRSIAKVLANLTVHESLHEKITRAGWVPVLHTWLNSLDFPLTMYAAKALANLDLDTTKPNKYVDGVHIYHPQHRQNEPILADVVFIHGLMGGPARTWRQADNVLTELKRQHAELQQKLKSKKLQKQLLSGGRSGSNTPAVQASPTTSSSSPSSSSSSSSTSSSTSSSSSSTSSTSSSSTSSSPSPSVQSNKSTNQNTMQKMSPPVPGDDSTETITDTVLMEETFNYIGDSNIIKEIHKRRRARRMQRAQGGSKKTEEKPKYFISSQKLEKSQAQTFAESAKIVRESAKIRLVEEEEANEEDDDGKGVPWSGNFTDVSLDMSNNETNKADSRPPYSFCWPKDWLPEDIPNLRVLTVEYDTRLSEWFPICPYEEQKRAMKSRSKELLEKLHLAGVGQRPVIWVGHSMGGLIIKQILLNCLQKMSYNNVLEQTNGVVFLSVPHKGSPLIAGSGHNIAKYLSIPSIEIKELEADSPQLLQIHEDFKKVVSENDIAVLSLTEGAPTQLPFNMKKKLVPETSSNPGFGEYRVIEELDHKNICKPESDSSDVYQYILEFLCKHLPHCQEMNSSTK